jgi:hypothetical protein
MCCSSGVCGPVVDPDLTRFAADLDWLAAQGVAVDRFNLDQQPQAFVNHALVRAALEQDGEACLPLVLADGLIVSRGVYPSREALARAAGIPAAVAAPTLYTEAVAVATSGKGALLPMAAPGDSCCTPGSGCC